MKIKEHDCVVLTKDLPQADLKAGDVGTVVHVYKDGAAYEVEFVTYAGRTVAVATIEASQLLPAGDDMAARAKRANLADFDRIMAKVPDVPPMPGDELPEGYQRSK